MKIRSLLFSAICLLALGTSFISCSDDDNDSKRDDSGSKVALSQNRVFILNEGSLNLNNANISFYDPDKTIDFIADIFQKQNNAKLGDTGQNMIVYNDYIYVIVSGSKYITRLNAAGVEQQRFAFSSSEGSPRYMTADDGYIYVTQYGGKVSKLNANTLERVKTFEGGKNLEGIAEEDGLLYVANCYTVTETGAYEYFNEVFVIDANTMELKNTLTVRRNPNKLLEKNDKIFLLASLIWGGDEGNELQVIDPKNNNQVTSITAATHMAASENTLYLINSDTDYSSYPYTTVNTFFTYNISTKQLSEVNFLKNAPEELSSASIYVMEINEKNGDIYIGTTHYVDGNGDIYRFKKDGTFVEKFDCGGQNPNNIVFL